MDGVALITGAASGIGNATARAFIRAGVTRIIAADVQEDKLVAFAEEVADAGVEVLPVVTDVTNAESVRAMVAAGVEKFGRVDYAVNCAGITGKRGAFAQLDPEDYARVIAINQTGVVYSMREELAVMEQQDLLEGPDEHRRQRGSIVNIASIAGIVGTGSLQGYCASKHAVVGLAKAAAIEYGAKRIRINNIAPGWINTPMTQAQLPPGTDPKELMKMMPPIPVQRMGWPEEIADVAVFLSGTGASYTNGATWPVDGGYTVV